MGEAELIGGGEVVGGRIRTLISTTSGRRRTLISKRANVVTCTNSLGRDQIKVLGTRNTFFEISRNLEKRVKKGAAQ